jgi:hypothetical protein
MDLKSWGRAGGWGLRAEDVIQKALWAFQKELVCARRICYCYAINGSLDES